MLKNLLISTIIGASPFISQGNGYTVHSKNKNFHSKLQSNPDWKSYDLSKLSFDTIDGKTHDADNFNPKDYKSHDFYVSYKDITSDKPIHASVQQDTYIELSLMLDKKLESEEQKSFGKTDVLFDEASEESLFNFDMSIDILKQSDNSTETTDNPIHSFEGVKVLQTGETETFYIRISNSTETDWTKNKSYFDLTLNIFNTPDNYITNVPKYIAGNWLRPSGGDKDAGWQDPCLIFEWDKYAKTWEDFTDIYKTIDGDIIKNSFQVYGNSTWYGFDNYKIDTTTMTKATWASKPLDTKTGMTVSRDAHPFMSIYHQHEECVINASYDTKYIYFRANIFLQNYNAQTNNGIDVTITQLMFSY